MIALRILVLFPIFLLSACPPQVGDECKSAIDCSATSELTCDRSLRGGYCTVPYCESDSCPNGARCVEWRYQNSRSSETLCMQACSKDKDCRRGDGYRCVTANDDRLKDSEGNPLARVIDFSDFDQDSEFCAYVED